MDGIFHFISFLLSRFAFQHPVRRHCRLHGHLVNVFGARSCQNVKWTFCPFRSTCRGMYTFHEFMLFFTFLFVFFSHSNRLSKRWNFFNYNLCTFDRPKIQYGHFCSFFLASRKKCLKSFCFQPLFMRKSGQFSFCFWYQTFLHSFFPCWMLEIILCFFFRFKIRIENFFKLKINVLRLNSWARCSVSKWSVKIMKTKMFLIVLYARLFNYLKFSLNSFVRRNTTSFGLKSSAIATIVSWAALNARSNSMAIYSLCVFIFGL